ncbi:DUF1127 domain-containing protein [Zestomonas carbonaria]|uniref:YjiS-like domain-containing protein n=1 Tax=Zestomonas carbonaria TaxID=2762745 RepID=A0A7U7ELT9_9GAMM|nr:DUF1127 domain-containing protein [Pseudomonas carbonaria]CAD5107393.1 hypothetical protein PSEWESI4_01665 [Pseudomonas carbonaria]
MERTQPISAAQRNTCQVTCEGGLLRLFGLIALWQQRVRTRRQLARLDTRLLADVNITPSERAEELRKPFWR